MECVVILSQFEVSMLLMKLKIPFTWRTLVRLYIPTKLRFKLISKGYLYTLRYSRVQKKVLQ